LVARKFCNLCLVSPIGARCSMPVTAGRTSL
jgi:hypothetical protein